MQISGSSRIDAHQKKWRMAKHSTHVRTFSDILVLDVFDGTEWHGIKCTKFKDTVQDNPWCSGVSSDMSGLVQYEDLLVLLTCLQCRCLVSPPVSQCRKGHLYCLSCKSVPNLFPQLFNLLSKTGKRSS